MHPEYLITLLSLPRVGRRTVQRLLSQLVEPPTCLHDLQEALRTLPVTSTSFPIPTTEQIEQAYARAEKILRQAEKMHLKVLSSTDPGFPQRLRHIPDPPVILYVAGNIQALDMSLAVAVIGTRKPSWYGERSAHRLGRTLVEEGALVVSGLALGCDAAGHRGCLEAKGKTAAVLAHGLDKIYPSEHRPLAEEILARDGCLVSEYAPGTRSQRSFFVERDRLQSGLSDAVIVVETSVSGGTMHTARFCVQQKRLLACVEHPNGQHDPSQTSGNNLLIDQGQAIPLVDRFDLLHFIQRARGSRSSLRKARSKSIQETASNDTSLNNQPTLFDEE